MTDQERIDQLTRERDAMRQRIVELKLELDDTQIAAQQAEDESEARIAELTRERDEARSSLEMTDIDKVLGFVRELRRIAKGEDMTHTPVAGYSSQTPEALAEVNRNKALEESMLRELDKMRAQPDRYDPRWVAIAGTHLEQAFMAANRAIMRPQRLTDEQIAAMGNKQA